MHNEYFYHICYCVLIMQHKMYLLNIYQLVFDLRYS